MPDPALWNWSRVGWFTKQPAVKSGVQDLRSSSFGSTGRFVLIHVLASLCTGISGKCGVYFVVIGTNLNYIAGWVSQRVWAVTGGDARPLLGCVGRLQALALDPDQVPFCACD